MFYFYQKPKSPNNLIRLSVAIHHPAPFVCSTFSFCLVCVKLVVSDLHGCTVARCLNHRFPQVQCFSKPLDEHKSGLNSLNSVYQCKKNFWTNDERFIYFKARHMSLIQSVFSAKKMFLLTGVSKNSRLFAPRRGLPSVNLFSSFFHSFL